VFNKGGGKRHVRSYYHPMKGTWVFDKYFEGGVENGTKKKKKREENGCPLAHEKAPNVLSEIVRRTLF